MTDFLAIGADVSINHSAFVAVDSFGDIQMTRYLCSKKMDAKKTLGGTRIPPRTKWAGGTKDKASIVVHRLNWLDIYYLRVFAEFMQLADKMKVGNQVYLALEDYAYAASQGAHQIGEVSGRIRLLAMDAAWQLRLHAPSSVKLWVTNRGDADKDQILAVFEESGDEGWDYLKEFPKGDVVHDVADALTLAAMARAEVLVSRGEMQLSELGDGARRVFLRTTKTYPTNLLDRPWVSVDQEPT